MDIFSVALKAALLLCAFNTGQVPGAKLRGKCSAGLYTCYYNHLS